MYFASDNGAGASPPIIAAVAEAMAAAPVPSYGNDPYTRRAEDALCAVFEREVAVFFCTSGTATNAMALAQVTPPWGAVYGHEMAHALATECGAPEFYSGAKLVPLPGPHAKLTPDVLRDRISRVRLGDPHHVQPATISVTNLTECGTLYRPAEVAGIAEVARAHGLKLHMDGARFANALASAGCSPADMTWKAGVDVLSLGATKNGAMAAEAVVFFNPADAENFLYRRMRGGHLLSKMRFVSAQFLAWLDNGHWLDMARHANAMARRMADGLARVGVRTAWAVEGNEVFAILSPAQAAAVRAAGVNFHPWPTTALPTGTALAEGEQIARLISSFVTQPEEVDELVAVVGGAAR